MRENQKGREYIIIERERENMKTQRDGGERSERKENCLCSSSWMRKKREKERERE